MASSAKERLAQGLRGLDPRGTGRLPRPVFEGVLREVCRANPAWLESLDLVPGVDGGDVHYEDFLAWVYGGSGSPAAAEEGAAMEETRGRPRAPAEPAGRLQECVE